MFFMRIVKLAYIPNKRKHSVDYFEHCQKLESDNQGCREFKAIVSKDRENGTEQLKKIAINWLNTVYFKPNPKDFYIETGFSEIAYDNSFNLTYLAGDCIQHSLE